MANQKTVEGNAAEGASTMKEKSGEYQYMVRTDGPKPSLVRVGEDRVFRRYDPRVPGKWEGSKFLDAFAWGGGDFVWYDDIDEDEALEYMKQIDAFWRARGEL